MPMKRQRPDFGTTPGTSRGRRKLLTSALLGAGGATAALYLAPERWTRPIIESVTLPVHAQTSQIELGAGGWFGGSASMVFRDSPSSGGGLARGVSQFLVPPANAGATTAAPCLPFLICIDRTGSSNEIHVRVGFDNMTGGVVVDAKTFMPNDDLTFNKNFSDGMGANLDVAGEYAPDNDQWLGSVQGTCGENIETVYNRRRDDGVFTGEAVQVASASDSLRLALAVIPTVDDTWIATQTDCSFDH